MKKSTIIIIILTLIISFQIYKSTTILNGMGCVRIYDIHIGSGCTDFIDSCAIMMFNSLGDGGL